jgi:SAM-dependent methyltransferase
MNTIVLKTIKKYFSKILYRNPVSGLAEDNLYAYLDALYKKRTVSGTILEVGCAAGGTAAIAYKFLERLGHHKEYICIDTFSGFIEEQFNIDKSLGVSNKLKNHFSANSKELVQSNLTRWEVGVKLIEGDIITINQQLIPPKISVCLLDVDLREPIFEGLKRILPNLAPRGIILVDDCRSDTAWAGALQGYKDFVAEFGLSEKYFMGFGVIENNENSMDWDLSSGANPCKYTKPV